MSLANDDLAKKVRKHFTNAFHQRVYDAALKSFDHEDNALRLNNFATALRELGRLWLEDMAPADKVRACDWFVQDPNLVQKNGLTRAQRIRYAVQQELHNEFVSDTLHIDVSGIIKEYIDLVDDFSKYTHITVETFDIPYEDAELKAVTALEVFEQIFELIEERRKGLHESAVDAAKDALAGQLYEQVDDALDSLSTHSSVEGVSIDDLEITSLTPSQIQYRGRGNVDVRLQFGSDSDGERGDGVVTHDGYPLVCEFEADTSEPLNISVVPGSLRIDTAKFYED